MKKITLFVAILCFSPPVMADNLSQNEAMAIAQQTDVVKAFKGLMADRIGECGDAAIVPTCDSEWVTCIDDAWVVKFRISEKCVSPVDDRMGVTLLIDAKTGEVLSHYPEVTYFEHKYHCLDDSDCLIADGACLNFIHALHQNPLAKTSNACTCKQGQCTEESATNSD